jgi:hypothetical protein
MNTDSKAIEHRDVVQEIADPKKAGHANGRFLEGGPGNEQPQCDPSASGSWRAVQSLKTVTYPDCPSHAR